MVVSTREQAPLSYTEISDTSRNLIYSVYCRADKREEQSLLEKQGDEFTHFA